MNKDIDILFKKYLSHDISAEENEKLLTWMAEDPELQMWFEKKFSESSSEMDKKKQKEILAHINRQIKPKQLPFTRWPILAKVAAILLIPLMLSVFALTFTRDEKTYEVEYCTVEAQKGQKTNIVLPDGSKVYLNSESQLIYATDFNRKERAVKLVGEAYFEITKNAECPFIVEARDMKLEVLGTSFNVKAYPGENILSAIITTGKVRASSFSEIIDLYPNDILEVNVTDKTILKKESDNARKPIAWIDNQLFFDNSTLVEVVSTLERIYNIEINITSESLKKHRFSGTINNNSLESVLRILSLSAPIKYKIEENSIEIYEVSSENKFFK
jgi:ferric-dicitrate binding protein FerR (iron transport regulator)